MSFVLFSKTITGKLAPGKTETKQWVDAPATHAFGFLVRPGLPSDDMFAYPDPIAFDIVKVQYKVVNGTTRVVEVSVKNSSPGGNFPSTNWPYTVVITQIPT